MLAPLPNELRIWSAYDIEMNLYKNVDKIRTDDYPSWSEFDKITKNVTERAMKKKIEPYITTEWIVEGWFYTYIIYHGARIASKYNSFNCSNPFSIFFSGVSYMSTHNFKTSLFLYLLSGKKYLGPNSVTNLNFWRDVRFICFMSTKILI